MKRSIQEDQFPIIFRSIPVRGAKRCLGQLPQHVQVMRYILVAYPGAYKSIKEAYRQAGLWKKRNAVGSQARLATTRLGTAQELLDWTTSGSTDPASPR